MLKTQQLRMTLLLALVVSLTACGFHLRGNIPLSDGIKNMYVAAPKGSFKEELEKVLERAGANLIPNQAGADVVLNVTLAELNRNVGTLDERGKVNSYNLVFRTRYNLKSVEGEVIRKRTTLRETRRYDFDPLQVVATESEERDLQEDMEKEIALRIVRQLSAITDYPAAESSVETDNKEDK